MTARRSSVTGGRGTVCVARRTSLACVTLFVAAAVGAATFGGTVQASAPPSTPDVPPSLAPVLGSVLEAASNVTADHPDVLAATKRAADRLSELVSTPSWDVDVRLGTTLLGTEGSGPSPWGRSGAPHAPSVRASVDARWSILDPEHAMSVDDARSRAVRVAVDTDLQRRASMLDVAWAAWTADDLRRKIAWIDAANLAGSPVPDALTPWADEVRAWATSMQFEVDRIDAFLSYATGWSLTEGAVAPWQHVDWEPFLAAAPMRPCLDGDEEVIRARADVAWASARSAAQSTALRGPRLEVGAFASTTLPSAAPDSLDLAVTGWLRLHPPRSWRTRTNLRVDAHAHGVDAEVSWSPGAPTAGIVGDDADDEVASARAGLDAASFHARDRAARDRFTVERAGTLAWQREELPDPLSDVAPEEVWQRAFEVWPRTTVHAQAVEVRMRWAFACHGVPASGADALAPEPPPLLPAVQ